MKNRELVFVYGSLMKGEGNHDFLKGSMFLGNATVKGKMYSVGGFPAVIEGKGIVKGEIYLVSREVFEALDRLEGYNEHTDTGLYLRRPAKVTVEDKNRKDLENEKNIIWYYVWGDEGEFTNLHKYPVVPSGEKWSNEKYGFEGY